MIREIARAKIILTVSPNELALVPVKINGGGPYQFIIDTGASCCCLSKELARELKIRHKRTEPSIGANGAFSVTMGKVGAISIGKAVRRNLDVAIFDFDMLKKADKNIGGIIGYNFLNRYIVTIDYERNELSLCKR